MTQHGNRWWKRTYIPTDINPFITHSAHESLYHTTGVYPPPPTLYEQQCEFFYVPQEWEQWKRYETGPTVFLPYPRRLECLTICRYYHKGSTFSSATADPACWSGWGLNLRPPAQQTGAYKSELTGGRFLGFIVGYFVICRLPFSVKIMSTRIITDCTRRRRSLEKPRASERSRKWTSFLFCLQNNPRIRKGGVLLIMAYIYMGRLRMQLCRFQHQVYQSPGNSRFEVNERIRKSVFKYS